MKTRFLAVLLGLAGFAACAPAGAQAALCTTPTSAVSTTPTTTSTDPTTTTTTTPVTPPPVIDAQVSLRLSGLFTVKGARVSIPRRAVTVNVTIAPYVSGEPVTVTEALNGHPFRTVVPVAGCQPGGTTGSFSLRVVAPRPGRVTIAVAHVASPTMDAFQVGGAYAALNTAAHPGSRGRLVTLVQQRLAALHLYIPQTGVYDQGTELALDAYHRLLGEGEGIQTVSFKTLTHLLNGDGRFHVRYPGQGHHAEGDLSDQLLAFTVGSRVHWIFPISSGKPSTPTILGRFQVYYRVPGYLPDGMYFSSFFHSGYAIHGYDPAPDYPASHGCMRLPIVDAIPAFGWIQMGDWVDTYYT